MVLKKPKTGFGRWVFIFLSILCIGPLLAAHLLEGRFYKSYWGTAVFYPFLAIITLCLILLGFLGRKKNKKNDLL